MLSTFRLFARLFLVRISVVVIAGHCNSFSQSWSMTAQKFSSENIHCAARSIGNVFMPIRNFSSLGLAGDFEGVDFGMSANALLYLGHQI
jgi:hypothetical protein